MSLPRITVITPVFNSSEFLERAICSVLDQGYPDLEYWVVDGGNDPDTAVTRCIYEPDVAGWINVENQGLAAAINAGLKRATGQIVAVLAAEDVYLPGALEAAARAMTGREAPQWLVGQCLRMGTRDQMLGWLDPAAPQSLAGFLMHDSGMLPLASSFFRRELLEARGDFDTALPLACDYEYACRLLAADVWPGIMRQPVAARREEPAELDAQRVVQLGLEHIIAGRRYAYRVPVAQRYLLWRNFDARRRIYKLAEAENRGGDAQRFLWQELLRHPWWMANHAVRRALRGSQSEAMTGRRAGVAA